MLEITKKLERKTKKIAVGSIYIGGDYPVTIQSMTNTDTKDVKATVNQIESLVKRGCEIVRVAVPDKECANAIKEIKKHIEIPLVADIHFDYKLAVQSIQNGADKIRINPGNIGGKEKLREVVNVAKQYSVPIRVGVNSGSLEKDLLEKHKGVVASALVESAQRYIEMIEDMGYYNIVLSLKASNVSVTVNAYRLAAKITDYPLHVGVTEAGTIFIGTVKSSIGIGALLLDGIGDTLRVSLTGDPCDEIKVAKEILKACGLRKGIEFITCPTCGRCKVDLISIANNVYERLTGIEKDIKIAIMGCAVNGPGEAKDADVGVAGGLGEMLLFKKGEIVRKIKEDEVIDELIKEVLEFERDLHKEGEQGV